MDIKSDHIIFTCSIQTIEHDFTIDPVPDQLNDQNLDQSNIEDKYPVESNKIKRVEKRFLMSMGFNDLGQLGHNDYQNKKFPFIVP